jgi:allophanate hydrolase
MDSAIKPRSPKAAAESAIAADRAFADPALWITRVPDETLRARAAALEAEGPRDRPLWGVTVAVKDNIDVAGLPTTAACPAYAYNPAASAEAVARLEAAGALILGKTNLDQFATGLVGVRSPYGTPRNVYSKNHIPGGSSSGSAVAVAAGIADIALGTDTAGSGRVPAMFGKLIGFKPTVGAAPSAGMVPACRSIDTISIFSTTVADAMRTAKAICGYHAPDPYSRRAPYQHLLVSPLPAAPRIACADVARLCSAPVNAAYDAVQRKLAATQVDIAPFHTIARLLYEGPWVAERTAALRIFLQDHPDSLHPTTRVILESGFTRSAVDAFDAFHTLVAARRFAEELFASYDALILPTAPYTPTLAEVAADPIGVNSAMGSFTNFVNLCDLAAIAVPTGMGDDGLPSSVTLIGPAWSEARLAAIAAKICGETIAPDALSIGETALFCIGAHMAGLPLNSQITSLGGRFIAEAKTTPSYKLFALGKRPGMMRAEGGSEIVGEIWALPTTAIGALLAQVQPPLGLGAVQLQSGPCLGFLAETAGVAGAPDITRHQGWRAWLATGEYAA